MSSRIAIVTDTDASLPVEIAARYGIRLVPISINFGEEIFRTGVDINEVQLFERVDREGKLPTTSAPPPGDFIQAFQEAFDEGAEKIVCFTITSTASAVYGAALSARDMMEDRDITVVDSRSMSMGQGFMTIAAAEAAQAGASVDEVVAEAMRTGERVHLYGALSTLKYLAMSGRVGHMAAGMASLLNVKPILTLRDGKLDLLEKVRTRKKAWMRVIDLATESMGGACAERMAILHSNAPEDARQFELLVREHFTCPDEVIMSDITPGLAVHTGGGLVGLTLVAAP